MVCKKGHRYRQGNRGNIWICPHCVAWKIKRGDYLANYERAITDRMQKEHDARRADSGLKQDMTVRRRAKVV